MVPTITDAISEAGKIVSIMYKTLMAASCNPFALGNVLYSGYDVLTNTDSLPLLYKTSGKLVTSMMTIEHFVTTVMDVIVRGWDLYQTHFAKMEQKEASEAKQRAAARGEAYDFDPFGEPDAYAASGDALLPNVLDVGLARARELAVKDKAQFYGEGSSDPFVIFSVAGADGEKRSTVPKPNLQPDFNRTKKWYALKKTPAYADASDGYFDDDDPLAPISGDVELVLRWRYDPEKDGWDPFGKAVGFPDQKPNCLKIGVFRAKDLSRVDRASSDPRARFESTPRKQTTCPVWKEIYAMRLTGKNPMLTCFVEDWDAVGRADPMGSFRVELGPYADRKPKKKWFALSGTRDDGTSFSGQVLLWLQWTYDPHPPKKERETCYDALLECLGQDAGATAQVGGKKRHKRRRPLGGGGAPAAPEADWSRVRRPRARGPAAGPDAARVRGGRRAAARPRRLRRRAAPPRRRPGRRARRRRQRAAAAPARRARRRPRRAAAEDGGAPPAAEGDAAAPSVKLPKSDAVRSQSKGVMGGVLDGVRGAIADVGNVVKLAGDLGHLHSNFDEAIESLAYVEHCVPKIVSALEMLQSVVQVILKASRASRSRRTPRSSST
ncbi:hypothetical protein JL720_12986 [Aureococcus anophagefferens]|nr:hypothetical protein JL720_12986 [Aureococcus anophagefferens]